MAEELASMFNQLSLNENDFVWDADGEEPIVGKDMVFEDDPVPEEYSEKTEGSDGKTYETDETDKSEGGSDEKLVNSAHLLIPKGTVKEYVINIMKTHNSDLEIEDEAMDAIHTALEGHLIKLYEFSKMIASHYGRADVITLDVTLANKFI